MRTMTLVGASIGLVLSSMSLYAAEQKLERACFAKVKCFNQYPTHTMVEAYELKCASENAEIEKKQENPRCSAKLTSTRVKSGGQTKLHTNVYLSCLSGLTNPVSQKDAVFSLFHGESTACEVIDVESRYVNAE